uniref:Uncharacterized protein n=2 Tax=Candidatus Kentrum sp. FM TaxID=2126340 RepID=A0A450W0C5_9GAMM|nr:MAG: hypothetical protein BECKFM1743B_GA0114221_101411 [Candidatus Kentron sp. FM]
MQGAMTGVSPLVTVIATHKLGKRTSKLGMFFDRNHLTSSQSLLFAVKIDSRPAILAEYDP